MLSGFAAIVRGKLGALIGAVIAGPAGAVLGGIAGLILGAIRRGKNHIRTIHVPPVPAL